MATSDRGTEPTPDADPASRIRSADFVTVSATPTADALTGTAILVRTLQAQGIPFHVRVGTVPSVAFANQVATIEVGAPTDSDTADIHLPPPAGEAAQDIALSLSAEPDPIMVAAARQAWPDDPESEQNEEVAFDRSAGMGVPGAALDTDVVHSTLIRCPWSGPDAEETPPDVAANNRTLASLVALDALASSPVPDRAAAAIGRALNPLEIPDGPFETVEGYIDVLDVLAACDPGTALTVACNPTTRRERTFETWRTVAGDVHARLATGPDERSDDCAIYYDAGAAAHTLARLARDFAVTASHVIAVGDGTYAAAAGEAAEIDRVVAADPGSPSTLYRHGPRVVRGEHTAAPAELAATLSEVLA